MPRLQRLDSNTGVFNRFGLGSVTVFTDIFLAPGSKSFSGFYKLRRTQCFRGANYFRAPSVNLLIARNTLRGPNTPVYFRLTLHAYVYKAPYVAADFD